jgi:hypothetical protein
MVSNLTKMGIVRRTKNGIPDLETCKQYQPDAVARLLILYHVNGAYMSWDHTPDSLMDAFRDKSKIESRHLYGDAFDIAILSVIRQIEWADKAVHLGLFTRVGFYPHRRIIHVDNADDEWCSRYNGTPYWVKYSKDGIRKNDETKDDEASEPFDNLVEAEQFALQVMGGI